MGNRLYLTASVFAAFGAVLHFAALPFGAPLSAGLLGGLIWAALAFGLFREWRLAAYVTFLTSLFGISAAMTLAVGGPPGPVAWLFAAIVVVDVLIALTLIRLLWSAPARP
ncbi:hypothetical protein [Hasllibacter sp. MH4015]|uniref:hypothetical protein n=1 Tax=Hasllibacter sp. MH4015 TaxID=2854029 RepID=UPI001CD708F4|nr:hypothetical protein [Hasllibacter sp. MH4015]